MCSWLAVVTSEVDDWEAYLGLLREPGCMDGWMSTFMGDAW